MNTISANISKQILTIGPEFDPPKGGIEMVLFSYSLYIQKFQFISSWRNTSKFKVIIHFITQIPKIIFELKKNKEIKIIHLHGSYKGSIVRKLILLYLIKILFDKKIIYHSHGSKFEDNYKNADSLSKFFIKKLIENADVIICLSYSWKSFFESNFSCKKVAVLNNIINLPELKIKVHERNSIIKFLYLGLIGERKGIYDVMNLIINNRSIFESKIEIHIGGNGETENLERIIKENQLETIIKFHGWVSGSKKIELLNDSDVFILPSYNEGLPIAILEAMSYSLPIISTKVGGIPEIIDDGLNGFLITPGNLKELKKAMLFFIDDENSIKLFGINSKLKSQLFFPENVLNDLTKIYSDLLLE